MNRIRRTPSQWNLLIKAFNESELKAVDFCIQHNIDQKYFSKKKNEININSLKVKNFVKVHVNKPNTHKILMSININSATLNFHQLPDVNYLSDLMKLVA